VLREKVTTEDKGDPYKIADWANIDIFDHVSRIVSKLGDPKQPQFRRDTVIVVQGLPITRDSTEGRTVTIHKLEDMEYCSHAVTTGIVQIKKYDFLDQDSQEGINPYGSYRMAANTTMIPEMTGYGKKGDLSQMIAFARDEWFGAKDMYSTPDPFGINSSRSSSSLGYNSYQPMAKRWYSFYQDRLTQHIAGLSGTCQIALIGDPIPGDILKSCSSTQNPIVTIGCEQDVQCHNELNYGVEQQIVAYRSSVQGNPRFKAEIPEGQDLNTVAVYSFRPPHLQDIRSTKIPIDLEVLFKQIEKELLVMKAKIQGSTVDTYKLKDATEQQIVDLAQDLIEEFKNTKGGTKLVPTTITLISSIDPTEKQQKETPFRASRRSDNGSYMISNAISIEPGKDFYKLDSDQKFHYQ